MEITKDVLRKLEKYGTLDKAAKLLEDEDDKSYILLFDLRQLPLFDDLDEKMELPFFVYPREDISPRITSFVIIEEPVDSEEITRMINVLHSKTKFAKFYIDDAGDVCCEATLDLNKCSDDDLEQCFRELVMGYLSIFFSVKEQGASDESK